jgi:hypothetical protein
MKNIKNSELFIRLAFGNNAIFVVGKGEGRVYSELSFSIGCFFPFEALNYY